MEVNLNTILLIIICLHFAFVCRLLRVNVKSNNCILFLITTKSYTRTKHDTKLKD